MDDHRTHHDAPWRVTRWWWVPIAVATAICAAGVGAVLWP